MRIVNESFASEILGGDARFVICAPAVGRPSGVLYLLHGLFGAPENWLELTTLENEVERTGIVAILVDGRDSWYVDGPRGRHETFFFEELMPRAESLAGIADQPCRGVAGLSMGGCGALRFAFRRPDLFAFAASMSGAFGVTDFDPERPTAGREELAPSVREVFGAVGSDVRTRNDVFAIAAAAKPEELPPVFVDCGSSDVFLDDNRRLRKILESRGIVNTYEEIEGGHDWDYWSARLPLLMTRAADAFAARKA